MYTHMYIGSSVHGISQARILEWVAISSSTHAYKCARAHTHTHAHTYKIEYYSGIKKMKSHHLQQHEKKP